MNHRMLKGALMALALHAGLALAAPVARTSHAAAGKAQKPSTKVKLVDINAASKAELKTLPGITEAYANKIIAGRPYLTKAHLVTHKILPGTLYEALRKRIVAKQPAPAAAK